MRNVALHCPDSSQGCKMKSYGVNLCIMCSKFRTISIICQIICNIKGFLAESRGGNEYHICRRSNISSDIIILIIKLKFYPSILLLKSLIIIDLSETFKDILSTTCDKYYTLKLGQSDLID